MPQAVLAVDQAGTPLFKNVAARDLLKRAEGLLLKGGKLTASRARDARRLASCVSEMAARKKAERQTCKFLKIEKRGGNPYALFIAPLHCEKESAHPAHEDTAAVVIVLDLDRQFDLEPKILEELFGLTRAEARLSCALLSGHGIDTAAELFNVSLNTARTQVRSIFGKLHLSRQQQLIRLLSTLTTFDPRTR
jgi:DNA-binding CsgD family transcriptional regulator